MEGIESWMTEIAVPANKIDGLLTPKFERRFNGIDERRNKPSSLHGDLSFVFYPFRNNGMLGPKDHDARRGFKLMLDDLVVGLTGDDISIPPDREAFCLQCFGQLLGSCTVLAGVTDENISHRYTITVSACLTPKLQVISSISGKNVKAQLGLGWCYSDPDQSVRGRDAVVRVR